ncbi:MAG TPA: tetratricopeptide repeat protein, partial [Segetibacter sp.]
MKKLTTLLLAVLFTGKLLLAQTVDDARKSLYYGRTTSAKQTLDKLVAANPKDANAIYWLGQTLITQEDLAGARQVYQNALTAGVNDPLVWVGMGHVELLEGKKDAARQRFEAAITNSISKKKENPVVLNAIGRANADGPANTGDPAYAIDVLKRASALEPNNADIYTNLGINYLKLGPDQGGNAYEAFTNALRVDPKYARANFRLGKIFQSQNNSEKFLSYYNQAVTADPAYAPAYLELYDYYSLRDVNAARGYLESYIANSDKDCSTDAAYADYLFRAGKYQESLDKAKAMESGACKNFPG